jgi:6-phosphofructokinase 1
MTVTTRQEKTLPAPDELVVATLGPCRVASPLWEQTSLLCDEDNRILVSPDTTTLGPFLTSGRLPPSFESAGPRSRIFFEPGALTCGIVTCGGLCPGLNDVIRSIVLTLTYMHRVRRVLGFRYGYAGLASDSADEPLVLTPDVVDRIHEHGGTILGSSRGPQDLGDMVDTLVRHGVGILFAIGGDGTLRGASALSREITRRKLPISVVGIPKTIDNDLEWTARSFGFATAVEAARHAVTAAHTEAMGVRNGIGIVKLMGRYSGLIAAHATLASGDVNFCLVPEVPFELEGERGFLRALERRLERKAHALIVVAEGAGQNLIPDHGPPARDASGNMLLKDIGAFVCERITQYFVKRGREVRLKYIDPSYTIRSLPANSIDSEFCLMLAQHAVHAGVAGRTNMVVGYWNQRFVHVPIALAVRRRRQLDPQGEAWQRVLEATVQPAMMRAQSTTL